MEDLKKKSIEWFKLLMDRDFIIVDTETTGLKEDDEIIEIGVLGKNGKEIYHSKIKPEKKISYGARATHGVSDEDLKDSPGFFDIYKDLYGIMNGNNFCGYSAYFDYDMIQYCCIKYDLKEINSSNIFDVMRQYANYWGEWNDYFQNCKWQKLTNACIQQGIEVNNSHSAIGDCKLTLELIKKIAEK